MKTIRRLFLPATLGVLFATLVFGAANMPNALPDSSHPSSLTATFFYKLMDEVYAIANESGLNYAGHGKQTLAKNGSVEVWSAGGSAAPDDWTLAGTGAAVSQQSDGQDGTYSAQITAGSAASSLSQTVVASISSTVSARLRGGVYMTLTARAKSSAVNSCAVRIGDGVGTSTSPTHSGGGSWENLTITRALDPSSSALTIALLNNATDSSTTCRFDSVQLLEGRFPQRAMTLRPIMPGDSLPATQAVTAGGSTSTGKLCVTLDVQTGSVCTGANTTETDLFTYTLPANALTTTKAMLRVTSWGVHGATSNTVTVRHYLGSASLSNTHATNGAAGQAHFYALETGANAQQLNSAMAGGGTTSTYATATQTTSGTLTVKTTAQNGTSAANDWCAKAMITELCNP